MIPTSNAVTDLLAELAARGVRFRAAGDQLRIKPGASLTPDQRSEIGRYKDGILALARRVAGTDPVSAEDLRIAAIAGPPPTDPEMASWSEDALFTYRDRLAIGEELGMDISPGSEAEQIARREARRAHAEIPADFGQPRTPGVLDAALKAFLPLGGLSFIRSEPRIQNTPGEDASAQKLKDSTP